MKQGNNLTYILCLWLSYWVQHDIKLNVIISGVYIIRAMELHLRNLSLCLFFWNRIVPSTRAFMGHFVAMLAMLRMQGFLLNLWAPTFTKIWRYQTHVLQLQGGRRNIIGKIYEILMVNVWVCEYMHLDVGPWKMKNNLLWIIHFGGGSVKVFGVVGK